MGERERGIGYKLIDYTWAIVAILLFIASIKYLNDGTLSEKVSSLGVWAPLTILILKASTLVFAPLGGTPLYVISGALYGTVNGVMLCLLGDFVGFTICFTLSRKYGMRAVRFFAGGSNLDKIEKSVNLLNHTSSFIKARIAFAGIPELLAYAAGLSKIRFLKFIFFQMIFSVPTVFVMVYLGETLAIFSVKYAFMISLGVIILAALGIWSLSKDYRKVEGM